MLEQLLKFAEKNKDCDCLIVGAKEYELLKKHKLPLVVGEVVKMDSFLDAGYIELFYQDEQIRGGIRGRGGRFYKIVGDFTLLPITKPKQPDWFKKILNNV